MKTCFKCKITKPKSEFYKHPKMPDGYLGKCKECAKVDAIVNRVQNLERYQQYDRDRKNQPERLAQRRANAKRRTRLFPGRRNANTKLSRAIKVGTITRQPCEVCGISPADAHHDDYSKPLAVRWLCPVHHHAAHRKYDYDKILKAARAVNEKKI